MLSNLGKESTALIHCILYLIHEDKKQSKTQTLCFLFLPFRITVKYAFKENQSKMIDFSPTAPLWQVP